MPEVDQDRSSSASIVAARGGPSVSRARTSVSTTAPGGLIERSDGQFTVLMRKRAAHLIEGCPVCDQQRRRMVNPVALLGSAPLAIPAPAWLRMHTLRQADNILPPPSSDPTVFGTNPGSGASPSGPGAGTTAAAADARPAWVLLATKRSRQHRPHQPAATSRRVTRGGGTADREAVGFCPAGPPVDRLSG